MPTLQCQRRTCSIANWDAAKQALDAIDQQVFFMALDLVSVLQSLTQQPPARRSCDTTMRLPRTLNSEFWLLVAGEART